MYWGLGRERVADMRDGGGGGSEHQRVLFWATDGWFQKTMYLLQCLTQERVQLSIIDAYLEGFHCASPALTYQLSCILHCDILTEWLPHNG